VGDSGELRTGDLVRAFGSDETESTLSDVTVRLGIGISYWSYRRLAGSPGVIEQPLA
jgi:hypothetical protein